MKKLHYLLVFIMLLLTISLISGCGNEVSGKANKQLELAVKYLSENKFEEAILAYKEVIKIDPKNPLPYKGISIANSMQGKMEEAEGILEDGMKQVPDTRPLKLAMAGLMLDQDKTEQADALYKELIKQDGKYLPAYQAYSKMLINQGKQAEAEGILEKAAELDNAQYKIYTMLAEIYLESGNKEKALLAIDKSLTIESNQSVAYKLLEDTYFNCWEELISLGNQYVNQNKNIPGEIIKLIGLYKLGEYREVIDSFEELAGGVKANAKTRLLVAQAYIKLGKKDQGINILKEIKLSNNSDASLVAEMASCYLEVGNKDTARKLAIQGIELDDIVVIDNYIILYKSYSQEDKSKANIWLTKYFFSSNYSMDGTVSLLEESLNKYGVSTNYLKDKTKKLSHEQLEKLALDYLQEKYPLNDQKYGGLVETHRLNSNIYLLKCADKDHPDTVFPSPGVFWDVYLVYNHSIEKIDALLDENGELVHDTFSHFYDFDRAVFKDINDDGKPEWGIVTSCGGSAGYSDCYIYNYSQGGPKLIFNREYSVFEEIKKIDGKYILHYKTGRYNTPPYEDLWYYWDGNSYKLKTNEDSSTGQGHTEADYIKARELVIQDIFNKAEVDLQTTRQDVLDRLGEPDETGFLNGGKFLYYKDIDIGYHFSQDKLAGISILNSDISMHKIKVGMSLTDVKLILGNPLYEEYDISGESDDWLLSYQCGSYYLSISANDSQSPVKYIDLFFGELTIGQ